MNNEPNGWWCAGRHQDTNSRIRMPSKKHQYQHYYDTWEQKNHAKRDGYAGIALQPEGPPEERRPGRILVYLRLALINLRKLWCLGHTLPDSLYETHRDVCVRRLVGKFCGKGRGGYAPKIS